MADERLTKRQKVSNGHADRTDHRRSIFAPYRTIGLVSPTTVPFTSVAVGKTTFQITTSVGHSLQTYDIRKGLHLNFLTRPQTPYQISASAAWKDKVVAAWGGEAPDSEQGVWIFKRGKKIGEFEVPRSTGVITTFCIFGAWIVGISESKAIVWKTDSQEFYTELSGLSPIPFSGAIAALPTFLNKVLIGREDGSVEIWNVSSGKCIYTILPPSTSYGAVTAIEPTPALSLAAIAYENGTVVIHDVQADQSVIVLHTDEGTPVTSLSFRTDGIGAGDDGRQPGVLATASIISGDITFWDLNNGGRRSGVLRAAHAQPTSTAQGGVSRIQFLPGQAILVSSGVDNSLKTWIFDETPFSPIPRVLHQRCGHGATITKLQFLPTGSDGSDDTGKWLLSASQDRSVWGWSLRRDAQSAELSQGAVQSKARKQGLLSSSLQDAYQDLKCSPVHSIACSLNRDGGIGALPGKQSIWQNAKGKKLDAETSAMTGWESIVTSHQGDSKARTWFWGRRRAGRWAFSTSDGGNVSAVAMSPCGTFALVGSERGSIDMFNMQSGQHRQHFPPRLTPLQAKQYKLDVTKLREETHSKRSFLRGQGRHLHAVVGLAVDEINKTVVSAGSDGKVKFWDFTSGLLIRELDWSTSTQITHLTLHRGANLAVITCTDACIRVIDITTYKLIRELRISRQSIPELQDVFLSNCILSQDARWVVASCGQLILVWDLPTGHLIDALKLRNSCTSLDLSTTGEYLAAAVEGQLGVEIWSNKSLFTYTPTRNLDSAELLSILTSTATGTTVSGENGEVVTTLDEEDEDDIDVDDLSETIEQLSHDLLSLSMVPRSRWQNLLNLDLIRQRNKPVEPPKKPEKAPFFLPSLQGQASKKAMQLTNDEQDITAERQRLLKYTSNDGTTSLLSVANKTNDYEPFLDHLKQLNPSAADVEIRSLSAMNDELHTFVHALTWLARQRKDFELGQTWMAVFLRVHGDIARNDANLRQAIREWRSESAKESQRVQKLAEYCGGLVGYLRAARV